MPTENGGAPSPPSPQIDDFAVQECRIRAAKALARIQQLPWHWRNRLVSELELVSNFRDILLELIYVRTGLSLRTYYGRDLGQQVHAVLTNGPTLELAEWFLDGVLVVLAQCCAELHRQNHRNLFMSEFRISLGPAPRNWPYPTIACVDAWVRPSEG